MPDEAHSSFTSDSLFGNNASDLLRAAMDPSGGRAATPPAGWQPPQPEELQAMLLQYEVTSFLGRGGMGAVYRGRQLSLERPVAIKILPPGMEEMDASYAERFRHEAMALARLRHLSIVAVYDFGQTQDGMFYIAMELIEGTDVARMIHEQGRLHSDHAMAITAHVCDALHYAHGQNIIHRDIKPSNIMVANDGTVKVTDFGLAKILHDGQPGLTRSGMALGTLQYMAPEALMLGIAVDHRADIYAVGVMLYHMLTGLLPQGMFELPSLQVPGLDPRFDTIIARALRNDRELRYQSAHEMRRDLDAVLTQPITQMVGASAPVAAATQPKAVPPQRKPGQPYRPPQKPAPKPQPRGMNFWASAIGGGTVLVALLIWLLSPSVPPERKTVERIEGEALKVLKVTGGQVESQVMTGFRSDSWSRGAQLFWTEGSKGYVLKLQFNVTEAESGRQRLKAVLTRAADYAVVDVTLDGRRVKGSPFDMQAEELATSDILDWGLFDLKAGPHVLEITLTNTHGHELGDNGAYCFGLDYIQLEPPSQSTATPPPTPSLAPPAPSTPEASPVAKVISPKNSSDPYAARNEPQSQTIQGTCNWEVGSSEKPPKKPDFWWEYITTQEQYLTPKNGAVIALSEKAFGQIDAAFAADLSLSNQKIPSHMLLPGRVVVFRTWKGKLGKAEIKGFDGSSQYPKYNIHLAWSWLEDPWASSTSVTKPAAPLSSKDAPMSNPFEAQARAAAKKSPSSAAPAAGPATALSPRMERHSALRIPAMQFTHANLGQAVAFLYAETSKLLPAGESILIVIDPGVEKTAGDFNLDARDIPLAEALRVLTSRTYNHLTIIGDAFHIQR